MSNHCLKNERHKFQTKCNYQLYFSNICSKCLFTSNSFHSILLSVILIFISHLMHKNIFGPHHYLLCYHSFVLYIQILYILWFKQNFVCHKFNFDFIHFFLYFNHTCIFLSTVQNLSFVWFYKFVYFINFLQYIFDIFFKNISVLASLLFLFPFS